MRAFSEIKNLIDDSIDRIYPLRLIYSAYTHIKFMNVYKIIDSHDEEKCMLLHSIGILMAEANELGVDALLSLRKQFLINIKNNGYNEYLKFLSSCYKSAYTMFYTSLNVEVFRGHYTRSRHKVTVTDITKDITNTVMKLRKRVIEPKGQSSREDEYIRLHLARTLAELGRLAYSIPELQKIFTKLLCKVNKTNGDLPEVSDIVRCIIDMAKDLANETSVSILAYIQIASTQTRTPYFRNEKDIEELQQKLVVARNTLDKLSIYELEYYDALSLYGSYHYNNGWFILHYNNKRLTPQIYHKAALEFYEAAKKFIKISKNNKTINLTFLRGTYVSLWNYYLMTISGLLFETGESPETAIDQDVAKDILDWGYMVTEAYIGSSNSEMNYRKRLLLVTKVGFHAWYSHLLSIIIKKIVLRRDINTTELSLIENAYPRKLQIVIKAINHILNDEVRKARNELTKIYNIYEFPIRAISSYIKGVPIEIEPPTLREYPVYSLYLNALENKDYSKAKKLLSLLLVYTL